jgi:hypothetical protein
MTRTTFTAGTDCRTDNTCTASYIRVALGVRKYGDRRMCTYLRELIAHHNFPRPLPTLRGAVTTLDVIPGSRWVRFSVDNWLEDFLPPEAAAALARDARNAAAASMDNAANLGALRLVSSRR